MGLFSRLKKAFSLPESQEQPAQSTASQVEESTASAAPRSAAESTPATPASSAATVPASAETVVTSATSTAPVSAEAQVTSAASTAPESTMTASQAVAASLAALSATTVAAESATTAPDSTEVVESVATSTATEEVEASASSETGAVTSAALETTEVESETRSVSPEPEPAPVAPASEAPEPAAEPTEAERYDEGLKKSRKTFGDRINAFLANFRHVDESFFDELEDTLIESDVGYETAMRISDELRDEVKLQNAKSKKEISSVIVEKLVDMYGEAGEGEDNSIHLAENGPTVILFVGVNGAGKTTTIGKMANMYKQQGKKVLLAACDTFRAGAIQQLQVWGQRDGVDVVAGREKSDPAAVCFDAVKKAKAEDYDILFVDTAGRLQNKVNLMNELEKIKRVITREIPAAPQEVLLVLDATTGQNALNQAKIFKQSTDVTGIVLTKLDGTARGGIVLAIRNELHLAVKYVGLGEKVTDLRPFNANDFVYGLFKDVITA
ncbi:signal recognition particle-docking protein FtsY [Lactiplantibacillus plajomi]|uniref:Signal recognition particle receptor FtsY n=1 Tax=Lactiplantibacillus plajomi TaxID=1457217 RepID=A0ABV6K571_9LACO|nr:signal recognition particle-docking protein FtsY [Lactiplantibacillus plajomi]